MNYVDLQGERGLPKCRGGGRGYPNVDYGVAAVSK